MNRIKSQFLPARVKIDGLDHDHLTREEALAFARACALLRKPFAMWQVGDPGWQCQTDAQRDVLNKQPVTPLAEFCARQLAIEDCDTSIAEELFPKLFTKADFGEWGENPNASQPASHARRNPSLIVGQVGITPQLVTAFRRGMFRWHVQSVDIDDHEEEFANWNDAIARAVSRAALRAMKDAQSRQIARIDAREGAVPSGTA